MNKFLIFFIVFFFSIGCCAQNMGIGTISPDPSSKVDISSTNKGFLPPRLTYSQRLGIQNPAKGLMIWCIDCDEMQVFNGLMWINLSGASASVRSLPGVKICYQDWQFRNLDVRTYQNGDVIPIITDPVAWSNLTTGAMCWYNNDSATYAGVYGRLYNWYAVNDPRGLAPPGWHVPTNSEWTIITNCLGGENIAGGKMKAISTNWTPPNTSATNSSGFGGLPGGARYSNGSFNDAGNLGYWWSFTAFNASNSWYRSVYYNNAGVVSSNNFKSYGFSVRCIRNW